jgi:hypothetical protein
VGYFALSFCLLSPWRLPWQYRKCHPMAAFSGFYESPGLPPSVDVRGIAALPIAMPLLSKWPATEVHLFAVDASFV